MKVIAATFLIVVATLPSFAQLEQPARFERVQKSSDDDFTIVSLKENGLALFRETDKYKEGKHSWQVILLDSSLNQKVDTLISVDREYRIIGYEHSAFRLTLLFQLGDLVKNKLILCTLNLQTFEIQQTDIKTELNIRLTHFNCIGSSVLLGGYISNEPAIVLYETNKASLQIVPGFLQRNTELLDVRVNENNTFNVVMVERNANESKRIIFRTFDSQGKLLLEDSIEPNESRTIQTAICSSLQREDIILLGTWGTRNSTRSYGFYATMINPFEQQKITTTTFGELSHYLDYLKPKRAQKIKAKTKTALADGKLYDYANTITPYKIIEHDKGFLALAENYSMVSKSAPMYYNNSTNPTWNNPYNSMNPYYNMYPTSRLYRPQGYSANVANEEEIKTYSSSLLSFNSKGILENDYSIKLEDVKISSFHQVTDVNFHKGIIVFLYKKKNSLYFKRIDPTNEEIIEENQLVKLKDSFDEFRNEEESSGGVRQWYSEFFFTWGYQTVRNIKAETTDKTREVFYINKLVVR
jgi:hypothetical protein